MCFWGFLLAISWSVPTVCKNTAHNFGKNSQSYKNSSQNSDARKHTWFMILREWEDRYSTAWYWKPWYTSVTNHQSSQMHYSVGVTSVLSSSASAKNSILRLLTKNSHVLCIKWRLRRYLYWLAWDLVKIHTKTWLKSQSTACWHPWEEASGQDFD